MEENEAVRLPNKIMLHFKCSAAALLLQRSSLGILHGSNQQRAGNGTLVNRCAETALQPSPLNPEGYEHDSM
jgi:hypothetical protein